MPLAIFDLDHTLLDGDSDVLWCQYLMRVGVLDRAVFEPRNRLMEQQYKAGTVSAQDFCEFYVSTLAGRSPAQWQSLRGDYLAQEIVPRIPRAAHELVQGHRRAGHTLLLSTATNRLLTELTAQHLGIEHLLATEVALDADGRCSGRTEGTLNMREGKVARLRGWLAERGEGDESLRTALFYSDSINDLPLLQAVGHPVAVNPDARLAAEAQARAWPVLSLRT